MRILALSTAIILGGMTVGAQANTGYSVLSGNDPLRGFISTPLNGNEARNHRGSLRGFASTQGSRAGCFTGPQARAILMGAQSHSERRQAERSIRARCNQ